MSPAAFVLIAAMASQTIPANVPAKERRVLMELFAATGGDRWMNRDGWGSSSSACNWYGVWCDFIGGDANRPVVVGLSLAMNNLEGAIPASLTKLGHLRSLSLSGNRLSGRVPEALLDRWDRHKFEFDGHGNAFSNFVVRATIAYSASGTLCSVDEDVRYRVEFDEPNNRATFQSVRCAEDGSRDTYCLVREGAPPSLARLSRSLKALRFTAFRPQYDYPFTSATHGAYLTTAAVWGDGSHASVETYSGQGPIEVWTAQQLFVGLLANPNWERETQQPKCDFEK